MNRFTRRIVEVETGKHRIQQMVEAMTNKQFGLICKGISHILANQEWIMRKLDPEDKHFYLTEDTNELSVKFGELAEAYYKTKDSDEK